MAIDRICSLIKKRIPLRNRGLLDGSGTVVPVDGTDGWQTGAFFQKTDGSGGTAFYINEGSVTDSDFNAIDAGAIDVSLDVGVFASLLPGDGIAISSTDTSAVAIYGDDAGLSIASSVYNLRTRLLLTTSQVGSSIRALMAQLKLADGVDVGTGIYTASQGYVELAGDTTVEAFATFSCFDASLEVGAGNTLTVDADGEVAGLHVETTGTGTITDNGLCAGVLVQNATGAPDWTYGIYVKGTSVVRGASFGQFAGSAATTSAVLFTTAGDVYSDGQLSTVEIHGSSSGNLGSGYSAKCLRARHVVNAGDATVEHETYGLMGQLVAKDVTLGHLHSGIIGTLEGHTSGVICSSPTYAINVAAITARIGGQNRITATDPVAGFLAFFQAANMEGGSAYAFATGVQNATYKWDVGFVVMDATCDTGISVGNCSTAGITVESDDDKVAGYNAIYSHINTGGITGWNAGRVTASRFKVTLDGSGNVGNVSAIWGGLNSGGTYTGLGQATCAAFEVVTTHVGSHPTAILYLTSAPGTSASHATMPYLVFAENPTGTGSNILFEVGSAPAAYTCTTGAGTLYHAETLQIKVNGNARYLPMSTVQTSFTTAYQIILTTTDPATATNGIYSNLVETATWTGSITPLRCRNTITTADAGGNCYGGWFNLLFDSGAAPTGLGLSCGLYVEAGSNVASTGVSSVLMATLLGDADGGVGSSPILTLADASTQKTNTVMEFGFNAGGTLLGTAADSTDVAFRTGGNAATNIEFKQGLRVMCNGAYYYIGLIAEGDWKDD